MFDSLAETLEDAFGQLNCFIQEQQQSAEEKERRTRKIQLIMCPESNANGRLVLEDLQIQIDTVKQNVAKLLQSVGL
jgi:hypothetical protein